VDQIELPGQESEDCPGPSIVRRADENERRGDLIALAKNFTLKIFFQQTLFTNKNLQKQLFQ
jgi:hypothetical protein